MDANSPILLFDSGVGGLTVYSAMRALLPDAPVIYAADLAGLPYGTKSEAEIAARVAGLLGRMSERYQPRLVCIACNTASTIALSMVRDALEVPIVGTVPAIKPAAAMTKTGVIGLLGTAATVRQSYVDNLETEFAADKRLLRYAATGLVSAAEAKLRGRPVDASAVDTAVNALRSMENGEQIDTVVLACTHFPLLVEELAHGFGPEVQFVDGSAGIARRIAHLTQGQAFDASTPSMAITTGDLDEFRLLGPTFEQHGISRLERF